MIVNFKFFYDKNYDEYNKLWIENIERIIFLPHDLPLSKQRSTITNKITDNKDILEIRFCSYRTITHNIIVNNIMLGKGFNYDDNKIWYPKEVWIYNLKSEFEM